jgi:hypothetical protein
MRGRRMCPGTFRTSCRVDRSNAVVGSTFGVEPDTDTDSGESQPGEFYRVFAERLGIRHRHVMRFGGGVRNGRPPRPHRSMRIDLYTLSLMGSDYPSALTFRK